MGQIESNEHQGHIQLFSGRMFNPLKPNADAITIEDIAHAEAQMCRYGGHSRYVNGNIYSVGEHSIHVSNILFHQWCSSPLVALAGLLHDCDEALGLPDVPRPVKYSMPFYRTAGEAVQQVVFRKFGLPWPMPDIVHLADTSVLFLAERPILMGMDNDEHWAYTGELRPIDIKIQGWTPMQTEHEFHQCYQRLWSALELAA